MPKKITSPHDLFLKSTLSSPQAIYDLFKAYLPEHLYKYIDIKRIVPSQPNHVSPSLKELRNDLIFTYNPHSADHAAS